MMITVMTAVYNRKELMKRLYQSLCIQTSMNFEWLIIDDGSEDGLENMVSQWRKETGTFPIRYYYRENGGKHRAWNYGVGLAEGKYIFVVDSDDYIVKDAIEKVEGWITQIDDDENYAGVSGCKGYCEGETVKRYGKFPEKREYVDASNLQRHRPNLTGDKAEVYRTALLKQYRFPEYEGEKFCTEDVVFHAIARAGYILRWFPETILIGEYREDGLTNGVAVNHLEYIKGYTYSVRNGGKYEQFPYNYVNMGEYIWTLQKSGISPMKAIEMIEIPVWQLVCAKFWFGIKKIRREILDNIENNK